MQNYGSKRDIQILANERPEIFAGKLNWHVVRWLSPLQNEHYHEYSDSLPKELGVDKEALSGFWPKGGPHWDGIAIDETNNSVLMIEAKAHITEMFNTNIQAKAASRQDILYRLEDLSKRLRARCFIKEYWQGSLYQMANRLAYLEFLNGNVAKKWRNRIRLVYLVFLNDSIVEKYPLVKNVKETEEAWRTAFYIAEHKMLALPSKHKLSKYIEHVFIDCNEFL